MGQIRDQDLLHYFIYWIYNVGMMDSISLGVLYDMFNQQKGFVVLCHIPVFIFFVDT